MASNSTLSQTSTSLLSSSSIRPSSLSSLLSSSIQPRSSTSLLSSSIQPRSSTLSSSIRPSSSVRDSASSTVVSDSVVTSSSTTSSAMSQSSAAQSSSTRRPSGDDPAPSSNPPSSAPPPATTTSTTTSKPPPPPSSSPPRPPAPAPTSSKPPPPATSNPPPQQKPPATPNSPPQQKPVTPTQPPPPATTQAKLASSNVTSGTTSGTSRSANGSATSISSLSRTSSSAVVPVAHSTSISTTVPVRPSVASGVLQQQTPGPTTSSRNVPTSLAANHHSDFFSQHGKVAGVFVAVGITVLAILALLPCLIARCRRRRNPARSTSRSMSRRPSMTSYADLHYRRASQIQAFGNTGLGGRPNSAGGSDESHAVSSETYHSSEPIVTRGLPSRMNEIGRPQIKKTPLPPVPELPSSLYPDVVNAALRGPINYSRPDPQLRNLAYLQPPPPIVTSRGSSPSLYPDDDQEAEERYWGRQGFERVPDAAAVPLPSPPDSALGLKWDDENELAQRQMPSYQRVA